MGQGPKTFDAHKWRRINVTTLISKVPSADKSHHISVPAFIFTVLSAHNWRRTGVAGLSSEVLHAHKWHFIGGTALICKVLSANRFRVCRSRFQELWKTTK